MHKRYIFILIAFILFSNSLAQTNLPLEKRLFIFSKTYATIPLYFAHWDGTPQFNLDSLYQAFLPKVLQAKTRKDFALVMMAFIANLNNGHSWYSDRQLFQNTKPLGFYLTDLNGEWVVTYSQIPDLPVGEVVVALNHQPIENWYHRFRPYISASSERARRTKFGFYRFLFPEKLILTTASGRTLYIDRSQLSSHPPQKVSGQWIDTLHTAYIKIPSFAGLHYENTALAFVNQFQQAQTLIIDLRGNGGGNTPSQLIKALQDRPYRSWQESTPVTIGLFKAYAELYRLLGPQLKGTDKDLLESLGQIFNRPQLMWPAQWEKPDSTHFTGKLIFLVDRRCASACEDFIIPFKDNHRAVLIGETTMGSSGQPYIFLFDEFISIGIGTKREYFPDGSTFEGRGIAPDIEVIPTAVQLKAGKDVVLERAIQMAHQSR